jgi:hypothetical protein
MLVALSIGIAQAPQDVEKRISALPADQRAFERFRIWIAAQPVAERGPSGISDQVRDIKLLVKYQAFLKESGFSEAEVNTQVKVVRQQGNLLEAEHWNRYLTAEHPTFNTQPNHFLVEMAVSASPDAHWTSRWGKDGTPYGLPSRAGTFPALISRTRRLRQQMKTPPD